MDEKLTRLFHSIDSEDDNSTEEFMHELRRQGYLKTSQTFYGIRRASNNTWLNANNNGDHQAYPYLFEDMKQTMHLARRLSFGHRLEVVSFRLTPLAVEAANGPRPAAEKGQDVKEWAQEATKDILDWAKFIK